MGRPSQSGALVQHHQRAAGSEGRARKNRGDQVQPRHRIRRPEGPLLQSRPLRPGVIVATGDRGTSGEPMSQQVETRAGIAYANHDGVSLLGDLYMPAGAGSYPALVAVHGGGWQAGARNAFQFWGPYLAERGYVLLAISYRLAKKGQKMFPQAVNDVLAAGEILPGRGRPVQGRPQESRPFRGPSRAPPP